MKVHYRAPYPEPDQSKPIHTIPSYLSKIHFNIVAHLRHARTVEPQKYVNTAITQQ
jgi:hypothetical protein